MIFKLNHDLSDDQTGYEPLQKSSDSPIFSPEIFVQTLQNFTGILAEKKGIEKSLWVKKFIERIDYSIDEIAILLYYKGPEDTGYGISSSGRANENAGRNLEMIDSKEDLGISDLSSSRHVWLPG